MHISADYKLIFVCVLSGLVVVGLILFYVFVLQGIISAQYAFSDLALRIADEEQGQQRAILAASLLKNRSDDILRIRNVLVDAKNPLPLIEQLEEIGRATHNAVALNVNDTQDRTGTLAVGVTVEGNRASVIQYLNAVELLPYALSVDEIDFQQLREGESALVKNAKILPSHRLTLLLHIQST